MMNNLIAPFDRKKSEIIQIEWKPIYNSHVNAHAYALITWKNMKKIPM